MAYPWDRTAGRTCPRPRAARHTASPTSQASTSDELVVETRGINGKQWLDHGGLRTSDKLTVIERFRRPSFGQLEIAVTIHDPTYYTKPWTVTMNARLLLNTELMEFICNENEKSTQHMGPNIKK